ncbi:MAG: hypothetical protein ACEQSB_08125, partial [Undibacterium sp.]
GFEQMPQQKQQITVSRSFPKEIYEREELERIVAEFASMCAEKLRAQNSELWTKQADARAAKAKKKAEKLATASADA